MIKYFLMKMFGIRSVNIEFSNLEKQLKENNMTQAQVAEKVKDFVLSMGLRPDKIHISSEFQSTTISL